MGKNIFTRIIVIICAVAFALLCIFIVQDRNREEKEIAAREEQYSKVNEKITALYRHRDELETRISEIKEYMAHPDDKLATVTFTIIGTDPVVINRVKDGLDQYAFPANIAVNCSNFPGKEGQISIQRIKNLVDDGWELIMEPEEESDVRIINYMLKEAGLPKASAVIIKDPDKAESIIKEAEDLEIRTVLTDYEIDIEEESGTIRIPAFGYRVGGIKDYTGKVIDDNSSLALLIEGLEEADTGAGAGDPRESTGKMGSSYDGQIFENMLKVIKQYVDSGICKVEAAGMTAERYRQHLDHGDEIRKKGEAEIEELEKEIEKTNIKIHAVHNRQ